MKVFAISDLHLSITNPKPMDIFGGAWENYLEVIIKNWQQKVSPDDIVLIAGDISWAMNFDSAVSDLKFLDTLHGKKVLLRGNHDYWWKSIKAMREAFPPSIFAVQNDCLRFGDYLIAGTRLWQTPENTSQTEEDKKIYLREIERLKLSLNCLQKMRKESDRTIVMTHYPPFNSRRIPTPFTELFESNNIDCVIYGHIHGKNARADKLIEINNIKYYLTSCDQIDNNPVCIFEE